MKKIFAFAMALVSMAAVMTSCSNDEADFIQQKAPEAPRQESSNKEVQYNFDGNIYFCAYESQFNYINTEYTVQVGSETMQVNVENLQPVNDLPSSLKLAFGQAEMTYALANKEFVRPTVFVYHIPANMKGEVKVFYNLTVKEGVDLPEAIEYYFGAATSNKNNTTGVKIGASNIANRLNGLSGRTAVTTSIK